MNPNTSIAKINRMQPNKLYSIVSNFLGITIFYNIDVSQSCNYRKSIYVLLFIKPYYNSCTVLLMFYNMKKLTNVCVPTNLQ